MVDEKKVGEVKDEVNPVEDTEDVVEEREGRGEERLTVKEGVPGVVVRGDVVGEATTVFLLRLFEDIKYMWHFAD